MTNNLTEAVGVIMRMLLACTVVGLCHGLQHLSIKPRVLHPRHVLAAVMVEREVMHANKLEACILDAESEDDVQACMQEFDAEYEVHDEPVDALEACILDAKSEDDVARCMQLDDERLEAQEHLEASFMSRSPPMRDANLIRAKAEAAAVLPSERDEPTELEACIVNAASEDDVQACMELYDAGSDF